MSETRWSASRRGRRVLAPAMGAGLLLGAALAQGAVASPATSGGTAALPAGTTAAPSGSSPSPAGSRTTTAASATTSSTSPQGITVPASGAGSAAAGSAGTGGSASTSSGGTASTSSNGTAGQGGAKTSGKPTAGPSGPGASGTIPPESAPVPGRSVSSAPIGGRVLVRLPGSQREVALSAAGQLPVGSVIDARRGAVVVVAAVDQQGDTKGGFFSGSQFVVGQTGGAQPLTTLRLVGGSFAGCTASGATHGIRAAGYTARHRTNASHRVVRQLWSADQGGRFQTIGRSGSAAVRGTVWLTQDRCDGTLYSVRQGEIVVDDHGHDITLDAGQSHLVPLVAPPALAAPSHPVPGASVTSALLGGKVTVRLPGTAQALPLTAGAQLPVGAVVDARQGAVGVVAAVNAKGATKTGFFGGAEFVIGQTHGAQPLTTLKLVGGSFAGCPAPGRVRGPRVFSTRRPRRSYRRVIRQLWGADSGGRFRTIGRSASAVVRGTVWLTQDRCDGTYFYVAKGEIVVHDKASHRNVVLHAGHGYLAAGAR